MLRAPTGDFQYGAMAAKEYPHAHVMESLSTIDNEKTSVARAIVGLHPRVRLAGLRTVKEISQCIADAAGALNAGAVARATQETLEPTLRAHAIAALQQRSRRRGVVVNVA